jgi:hypothetical protein
VNTDERSAMPATKHAEDFHYEVFDGRGIATVWTVRRRKYAADEVIECVGTVYGVHTKAEAREAWAAEKEAS